MDSNVAILAVTSTRSQMLLGTGLTMASRFTMISMEDLYTNLAAGIINKSQSHETQLSRAKTAQTTRGWSQKRYARPIAASSTVYSSLRSLLAHSRLNAGRSSDPNVYANATKVRLVLSAATSGRISAMNDTFKPTTFTDVSRWTYWKNGTDVTWQSEESGTRHKDSHAATTALPDATDSVNPRANQGLQDDNISDNTSDEQASTRTHVLLTEVRQWSPGSVRVHGTVKHIFRQVRGLGI